MSSGRKRTNSNHDDDGDAAAGPSTSEHIAAHVGKSFFEKEVKSSSGAPDYSKVLELVAQSTQNYKRTVQDLPDLLKNEKAQMRSRWQAQYHGWRLQLRSGFSLLFYGYGSKKALMDHLASVALTDGGLVVINGWHASITAKQIVLAAASALTGNPPSSYRGTMTDAALREMAQWNSTDQHVYVVINNIDGEALRHAPEQAVLASLAACARVHVLATVDHLHAPALFDKRVNHEFRWLWHHVPTFDAMLAETLKIAPVLASCKRDATHRSAGVVLRTLGHNSREVFKTLAEALLDDMLDDDEEPDGITYERWFRLCRERFLVSSDVTLRSHLTEFRDHELVKSKRGGDGAELLFIPLPAAKLKGVVADMAATQDGA